LAVVQFGKFGGVIEDVRRRNDGRPNVSLSSVTPDSGFP
jgi:hypothetical protein